MFSTPAIYYARNGHPLVERACATIAMVADLFREHWPTSAAVYLPGGKVPEPGVMFMNHALADTYARILREAESAGGDRVAQIERARKIWSQGFVAEAIDKFCRTQKIMDVSGERHSGLLTGADMAGWQAHVEPPLTYDYGRYTVCKPGVWSQGPVVLQQLALLQGLRPRQPRSDRARFHPPAGRVRQAGLSPTAKASTAIRISSKVPIETLLSDRYNAERRKLIDKRASLELRPGSVEGFGAVVEMRRADGARAAVGRVRRR